MGQQIFKSPQTFEYGDSKLLPYTQQSNYNMQNFFSQKINSKHHARIILTLSFEQ